MTRNEREAAAPVVWQSRVKRERFAAWINEPLSLQGRQYRLEAVATAFGLQLQYVEKLLLPPVELYGGLCYTTAIGVHLMDEILAWMDDHPDLNQNMPLCEDDITIFAGMDLG